MKQLLLLIVLALTTISVHSQAPKKVLFLGNSYTAVNNLPAMVNDIAESTGEQLIYDDYTPGGYRFMNHATDQTTLDKIASDNWDYVVLQGQSQETAFGESQLEQEVYPYAESLSDAIRDNNSCSEPMFYMTWGRENGDEVNCAFAPWMCTYEDMDDVIRATYIFMAESNDAALSPAGAVWRYLRENHPEIQLYSSDGSHPSLAGSYAVACAFYTMIYKKDPTEINWNSSLEEAEANLIKTATKTIVFDEINEWDFTEEPIADFFTTINDNEVNFTNTSSDFESVLWDFGDSNTSTEVDPVHIYEEIDTYTVTLTISVCEETYIQTKTIDITTLNTVDFTVETFTAYPNPTSGNLHLTRAEGFKEINIVISNLSGKSVLSTSANNMHELTLDLSNLSPGIYMLNIGDGNRSYVEKIIKR
ncbi:MAG TPA: T9SS type A sorting domain-containing protein [Flavobacteriaceae bacterium]|nr:T9SS type A sorting domain-containing protein [Flavobacteriaceae bacterium]